MEKFNFDFKKVIGLLLAFFIRKTKHIAWLKSVATPFENLHAAFIAFGTRVRYEIKWNGQTIALEHLLNDYFGSDGIYIENKQVDTNGIFIGEDFDEDFFIALDDEVEDYVGEDYSVDGVHFIVYVPQALVFNEDEMKALINKYKLYGTTYQIILY